MKFLEKSGELDQLEQTIRTLRMQKTEIEQQIAHKEREIYLFQESLDLAFKECMKKYIPKEYWIQHAYCRNDSSYIQFSLLLFHPSHILSVHAYERLNEGSEFAGYELYFKISRINRGWEIEPKELGEAKKQVEAFILKEIESDHSKRLYTVTNKWLQEETDLITICLDERQQKAYELMRQGVELYSAEKLAKLSHESLMDFKEQVF